MLNLLKSLKWMLCLLLTACLSFSSPVLAEDHAVSAPEISSILLDGDVFCAIGSQGEILCRDASAEDWTTAVSGEVLCAALPRLSGLSPWDDVSFDFAHAVLLQRESADEWLAVIPAHDGQLCVLRLSIATAEVSLLGVFPCQHAADSAEPTLLRPARTLLGAALLGDTLFVSLREDSLDYFVFALSLTELTATLLSEDPVCALLSPDGQSSQLLVCLDQRKIAGGSVLALLDTATGDLTRLCSLPEDAVYSGFTLSGDALYFTDGQTLFESTSPFLSATAVGHLPAITGFSVLPGAVLDGRYWTYTAQDGFLSAAISGEAPTVLRIQNALSLSEQQLVTRYLRQHPELTVVYESCNATTAPELRQHMESEDALDIYAFTLPDAAFFTLRDRGFLLDLRQNESLSAFADSLAPNLVQPLCAADGLYALPIGMPVATCWQINTQVLEEAGFDDADIPNTWGALLSLIRRYLDDSSIDTLNLPLVPDPNNLADTLFSQLFQAQLLRCENEGRAPTFTDADFVSALTDYIALRPALLDYEAHWLQQHASQMEIPDADGVVTIWSVYTFVPTLLDNGASLSIQQPQPPMQTLTLSFSGEEATRPTTMTVLAVSRQSPHAQEATSLLLSLMQGQTYEQQLTFLPAYQETVASETYLDAQEDLRQGEAMLEAYRAELDEATLAEVELELAEARSELTQLSPYRYSPEEIAAWHKTVSQLRLLEVTLFSGDDASAETLMRRFLDGELDTAQFVQQLTRIVQMMLLENA